MRMDLRVPLQENQEARNLGAIWDQQEATWYIDVYVDDLDLMAECEGWDPKIYLHVPYEEKDAAKNMKAKWNPIRKQWYLSGDTIYKVDQFAKWSYPNSPGHSSTAPTAEKVASYRNNHKTDHSSPSYGKKSFSTTNQKSRAGNAKDATKLRISDVMTVLQLKEECRFRGVKGLSGKNKAWLLDQLGVGSIWQTKATQSKAESRKEMASKPAASKLKFPKKPLMSTKRGKAKPSQQGKKTAVVEYYARVAYEEDKYLHQDSDDEYW